MYLIIVVPLSFSKHTYLVALIWVLKLEPAKTPGATENIKNIMFNKKHIVQNIAKQNWF